ncbi:MAG: hypothetical protein ACRYG8_06665 [Janthinobacterium lividum]
MSVTEVSNPQETVLERLAEGGMFSIVKHPERDVFSVWEGRDIYHAELTRDDLRRLGAEILALADQP